MTSMHVMLLQPFIFFFFVAFGGSFWRLNYMIFIPFLIDVFGEVVLVAVASPSAIAMNIDVT
jgi:hypothetical protein